MLAEESLLPWGIKLANEELQTRGLIQLLSESQTPKAVLRHRSKALLEASCLIGCVSSALPQLTSSA